MKKSKSILISLLLISVLMCPHSAFSKKLAPQKGPKLISIPQLKHSHSRSGTYTVKGYIVKIFTAKPNQCKPAMDNNIVISEANRPLEIYSLTSTELIIFVKDITPFKIGEKREFKIKVTGYKTTSEPIGDVELISHKKL